jgi:uncharacterized protein (DUF169 family)
VGLGSAKDAKWQSGQHMVGVWFSDLEGATAHQAAMHCVPDGKYEALVISPLAAGRLDPPDIALFYATPGAMMYFINGLQWAGYKKFDWGVVGESACADSWGRALTKREPSLSIPCFAERRYGGVLDDEMLMALPPDQLEKAIQGMEALAKNGFRYLLIRCRARQPSERRHCEREPKHAFRHISPMQAVQQLPRLTHRHSVDARQAPS